MEDEDDEDGKNDMILYRLSIVSLYIVYIIEDIAMEDVTKEEAVPVAPPPK